MSAPDPGVALKRFLKRRRLTITEFANKVGAHRSQIYRMMKRERGPGRTLAVAIERETGIPVSAWDEEPNSHAA